MMNEGSMTQENKAQSKSLLAKLLATEDITMQRSATEKTASFDIKNRVLYLPVWAGISNDLEDMLVVHEVGHALDTPLEAWKTAIKDITTKVYGKINTNNERSVKSFLNIVEDARIDKRQKRRYPGSRRNYLIGYKELIERDFFGTAKRDINSFTFIDRLNIYFKGGVAMDINFSNEEKVWISRAGNTETFEDVIKLTEEILVYCKSKGEETSENLFADKSMELSDDGDDDGDYEAIEGDGDADDDDDDDSEKSSGDEDDTEGSNSSDEESEDDEEGDKQGKTGHDGASVADEVVPQSETEQAWQEKQNQLVSDDSTEYVYVTVPKPIMKNIVDDYKVFLTANQGYYKTQYGFNYSSDWHKSIPADVAKFRTEENSAISFMVKEFEMKKSADIFSRISIAKTGVLDTNKIHSYKYNDDIFRRQTVVPSGKNHGFVMVLDWSGSMTTNIGDTVKQLITLTLFCKRVQIPFEVYMFRDLCRSDAPGSCFSTETNDLNMSDFRMRNILSSRMNSSELNEAYIILWAMSRHQSPKDPMSGTPLNQAIVATEYLVKQFKDRTKVQIVNTIFLTDGGSNNIAGIVGRNYDSNWDIKTGKVKKISYVFQDKITKKDYYFTKRYDNDNRLNGEEVTSNLLRILKDRTGCNLIGFYLYEYSSFKNVLSAFYGYGSIDETFRNKLQKSWSENKFVPVSNYGYDDYYVLNAKEMRGANKNVLSVDSSMSKAKIAKSFMTFSEKKSLNRVLLQRFISKIAVEKRRAG
jgi:hypothetical protein